MTLLTRFINFSYLYLDVILGAAFEIFYIVVSTNIGEFSKLFFCTLLNAWVVLDLI